MSTTSTGRNAESAAAEYLVAHGYKVLEQNWRTRQCEIDVVAKQNDVVYFVEVKYRAQESWGSGFEYITPKKLKQMQFAAELWVSVNGWSGDYRLSAIEATGATFQITNFLSDCT